MIEDLLINQPEDPINFMINHLGQADSKFAIIIRKNNFLDWSTRPQAVQDC